MRFFPAGAGIFPTGPGVPKWEGGNHFWTEVEREARVERQFESGAALIWQSNRERDRIFVLQKAVTAMVSMGL